MKKFMRIAFVAAFAAIAGYGVYTNLKNRCYVRFSFG